MGIVYMVNHSVISSAWFIICLHYFRGCKLFRASWTAHGNILTHLDLQQSLQTVVLFIQLFMAVSGWTFSHFQLLSQLHDLLIQTQDSLPVVLHFIFQAINFNFKLGPFSLQLLSCLKINTRKLWETMRNNAEQTVTWNSQCISQLLTSADGW